MPHIRPTNANKRAPRPAASPRRGAMLVLVTFLLLALLAVAALVINAAYIELTRTQLRAATDAVAKGAVTSLSQTQNMATARQTAKILATAHVVAGSPLALADTDIEFGKSVRGADGTYAFVAGATPTNSARVTARRTKDSPAGSVPTLLGGFLSQRTFEVTEAAIAARADNDVCLVIDRSGSMAWDLTSTPFSYPGPLSKGSHIQNYFTPPYINPDPSSLDTSRWGAVMNAVSVFQNTVTTQSCNANLALATYASNYTFGKFASTTSSKDVFLSSNPSLVTQKLAALGKAPVIGDTNIGAGMTDGIALLTDPATARTTAFKSMIVLTDGLRTEGPDPVAIAAEAWSLNITVHAITFGGNADQALMQAVAAAGHGKYYHAPTSAQLVTAFQQIALALPTILTK